MNEALQDELDQINTSLQNQSQGDPINMSPTLIEETSALTPISLQNQLSMQGTNINYINNSYNIGGASVQNILSQSQVYNVKRLNSQDNNHDHGSLHYLNQNFNGQKRSSIHTKERNNHLFRHSQTEIDFHDDHNNLAGDDPFDKIMIQIADNQGKNFMFPQLSFFVELNVEEQAQPNINHNDYQSQSATNIARDQFEDQSILQSPQRVKEDDFFISEFIENNYVINLKDNPPRKVSTNKSCSYQNQVKRQNFVHNDFNKSTDEFDDISEEILEEHEEQIPEIIEVEEIGNDDQNLVGQNLNMQRENSSQEKSKGYFLLLNDNESDDIEANQQSRMTQNNEQSSSLNYIQSSQATVFASGLHHIQSKEKDSPSSRNGQIGLQGQRFVSSPSQSFHQQLNPYHSVDGFLQSNQKRLQDNAINVKVIDWSTQSMNKLELHKSSSQKNQLDINQDHNELLCYFQSSKTLFQEDESRQLDQEDYEERKEARSQRNCSNSRKSQSTDQILHKITNEQELLLQRGRNSVLAEVEDDDIVNQNSSKSSSKVHSQERQQQLENRLELANHILSSFSQNSQDNSNWNAGLQLINQRILVHEEIKQEVEVDLINNGSINQASQQIIEKVESVSSLSSRRGGKRSRGDNSSNHGPLKFTYFAASSLSDDRWLCPICLDIYEDAVETPCCHNLFCEECIKKTPTCPLCNLRINGQLKPNIPIRRLVNELSIGCINQHCEDVIRKGEIDKHLKTCPFTLLFCPNNELCGKIIRKEIDKHKNEECPFRIVECLLKCSLMLPLNDMEDHISSDCPKYQINCKNQCNGLIERGDMDKHLTIDCPLQIVDCPNKGESLFEEGCQIRLKRKEMESHKLTCNYRRVYCQNQKCNAVIIYKDLYSHDERCLFKIIECENQCGERVQRQNIDKHKEKCENQLIKCAYYDLGCKVEILRKYYVQHLHEEGFDHSIIFIEGQKKKNREIDELKFDLIHLRQNYDVEIQAMFLELHRLKDEVSTIKQKTGINTQTKITNNNQSSNIQGGPGTKIVLGNNTGLGMSSMIQQKRDDRRFEPSMSSAGSGIFEMNRRGINDFFRQNFNNNERQVGSNLNQNAQQQRMIQFANSTDSNVVANSNTASLAQSQSAQSFDINNQQQNRLGSNANNQNNRDINSNLNQNAQMQKARLENRANTLFTVLQGSSQGQNYNQDSWGMNGGLYGDNSHRGRIPMIPNSNRLSDYAPTTNNNNSQQNQNNLNNNPFLRDNYPIGNMQNDAERKNHLALLLGSMNASLDSNSKISYNNASNQNTQQNNNQNNINNANNIQQPQLHNNINNDQPSVQQQLYQSYQNLYFKSSENFDEQRMSFGNANSNHGGNGMNQASSNIQGNINNNAGRPSGLGMSSLNDPLNQSNILNLNARAMKNSNQSEQSRNSINYNQNPINNNTTTASFFNNNNNTNQRRLWTKPSITTQNQPLTKSMASCGLVGLSGMNDPCDTSSRNNISNLNNNNNSNVNRNTNNQIHHHAEMQDLDSSNVIYDDDFEIEEEKQNY